MTAAIIRDITETILCTNNFITSLFLDRSVFDWCESIGIILIIIAFCGLFPHYVIGATLGDLAFSFTENDKGRRENEKRNDKIAMIMFILLGVGFILSELKYWL